MSAVKNEHGSVPADRVLEITRVYKAPRKLVYAAITAREHIARWMAPNGFTMPVCEGDLRVGGKWRCCMVSPEGKEIWLGGVYTEVVPDRKVVCTHAWDDDNGKPGHETLLTIELDDADGGTKLTLHQAVFDSRESREGHRDGWNECLDKLGVVLDAIAKGAR
jgi:uncharacterized protein YndB with AHSA1/START domain